VDLKRAQRHAGIERQSQRSAGGSGKGGQAVAVWNGRGRSSARADMARFQDRTQPLIQPEDGRVLAYQNQSAIVPDEGAKARALLDRVIAAKGGLETLRRIKSIVAVAQTKRSTPAGDVQTETTTFLQYPDRVRVETKLPDATVIQVYDGSRGWVKDPNGVHDAPAPMVREMEAGLKRDTIALLIAATDGRARARLLPDVRDGGGRMHHALELSTLALDPLVLLIDPGTSLVEKQTYLVPGDARRLVEEMFGDYRDVDGVNVAFTASLRQDGQAVLDRRVTEIRINVPIDPTLFVRPRS
jgi:hypothetical protein